MTALPDRPDSFILFVNGTLMRGFALHANLNGAKFIGEASTAPCYRLFSIDDIHPGMYEVPDGGVSVAGELYHVLGKSGSGLKPANRRTCIEAL